MGQHVGCGYRPITSPWEEEIKIQIKWAIEHARLIGDLNLWNFCFTCLVFDPAGHVIVKGLLLGLGLGLGLGSGSGSHCEWHTVCLWDASCGIKYFRGPTEQIHQAICNPFYIRCYQSVENTVNGTWSEPFIIGNMDHYIRLKNGTKDP